MFTLNQIIEAFDAMEVEMATGCSWHTGSLSDDFWNEYDALSKEKREMFVACLRLAGKNLGDMGALESEEDLEWFHRELVSYFPSFDIQI